MNNYQKGIEDLLKHMLLAVHIWSTDDEKCPFEDREQVETIAREYLLAFGGHLLIECKKEVDKVKVPNLTRVK